MTYNKFHGITAAALLAFGAPALAEDFCTLPGVTVLDDANADVAPGIVTQLTGSLPMGLPLDHADIISVQVGKMAATDGSERLAFTMNVASLDTLPSLPPNATWYISFKAPDKQLRGVRMLTDQSGAASFQSYVVSPGGLEGDGPSDGRFAEEGSEKPLDAASNFAGTAITFVVEPQSVGMREAASEFNQFNAAVVQGGEVPLVVSFADTLDMAPDDLVRRGSVTTECGEGAKSGLEKFGGALNFALLLPLALLGLRRRLR